MSTKCFRVGEKAELLPPKTVYSREKLTTSQINDELHRIRTEFEEVEKDFRREVKEEMEVGSDTDEDDDVQQGDGNNPMNYAEVKGTTKRRNFLESKPRRMSYYEPMVSNVNALDSFQCSNIPFISEDTDHAIVRDIISEGFPNKIHGQYENDYEISDQKLFNLMLRLLPATRNPDLLYYSLYHTFPNCGMQEEFAELFPTLVKKFAKKEEVEQLLNLENWKKEDSKERKSWPVGVVHPCSEANFFKKSIIVPTKRHEHACSDRCFQIIPNQDLENKLAENPNLNAVQVFIAKSNGNVGRDQEFLNLLILKDDGNLVKKFCNVSEKFVHKSCSEWFQFVLEFMMEPNYAQLVESLKVSDFATRLKTFEMSKKSIKAECAKRKMEAKTEDKHLHSFTTVADVTPCCHIGPCGPDNKFCSCVGTFCSIFCQCDVNCKRKFPGCNCAPNKCRMEACPCFRMSWECNEESCRRCLHPARPSCANHHMSSGKWKKVEVKDATNSKHGNGMFALEDIKKKEFIGEYVGERISEEERERRAHVHDITCSYDFTVPHKRGSVDSIRGGNEFRFVNHSDTPNCFTTSRVVQGTVRIGFYADRAIKKGEELFFNYNYSKEIQELMFHMSPEQRVLKFQMEMENRKTIHGRI
ncbi:unnamed protein product [Caenorhabditis brenneri]